MRELIVKFAKILIVIFLVYGLTTIAWAALRVSNEGWRYVGSANFHDLAQTFMLKGAPLTSVFLCIVAIIQAWGSKADKEK